MMNSTSIRVVSTFFALVSAPCALSAAVSGFSTSILDDTPYAYYRLGEASGTAVADSSGNGRGGTYVNSPTLSVAGLGAGGDTAATFNGTNQRASLTNLTGLGSSLGSFSMEYVMSTTATNAGILFGSTNTGSVTAFSISMNSSVSGGASLNSTRIFFRDDAGNTLSGAFSNATLYAGTYADLVITFDKSLGASGLKVYLNGAAQTLSTSTTGSGITAASAFSNFGFAPTLAAVNNRGTVASFAAATFDEAAFFTSVLSAADVSAHYAALTAIPEPSTCALLGGFAAGVLACVRRRRVRG